MTISQNIHRRTKTIIGAGNYDDDGNEGDEGDEGGSSNSGGGSTKSEATCTSSSSATAFRVATDAHEVAVAESFDILCDAERADQIDVRVSPTSYASHASLQRTVVLRLSVHLEFRHTWNLC